MAKVFNKKISPACEYCVYSSTFAFSNELICKHKGVVEKNDFCKKYKYDPLKRVPSSLVVNGIYTKSDFEL